jgi:hypothetical protein
MLEVRKQIVAEYFNIIMASALRYRRTVGKVFKRTDVIVMKRNFACVVEMVTFLL